MLAAAAGSALLLHAGCWLHQSAGCTARSKL
jgi:hypothetical protein